MSFGHEADKDTRVAQDIDQCINWEQNTPPQLLTPKTPAQHTAFLKLLKLALAEGHQKMEWKEYKTRATCPRSQCCNTMQKYNLQVSNAHLITHS